MKRAGKLTPGGRLMLAVMGLAAAISTVHAVMGVIWGNTGWMVGGALLTAASLAFLGLIVTDRGEN